MQQKVLVIDDDPAILELISDTLLEQGLDVTTVTSGEQGQQLLSHSEFDLVLLDIMMRGMSGLELCKSVREQVSCPIIFISAKHTVNDVVDGLAIGADDYITKPFVMEELTARIRAHLRRQSRKKDAKNASVYHIGKIKLNIEAQSVQCDGKPVSLSTKEFALLSYLMTNAGKTLSREQIYHAVWKSDYGDMGTVAINIKNLRTKIDPDWAYIKTVWGAGYRFVTQSAFEEQEEEQGGEQA